MNRLQTVFVIAASIAASVVGANGQLAGQIVASGLSAPVALVADPTSSDTLFIVQQGGRIRVLQSGALLAADLLNLSTSVLFSGEQGLLGMAFAPDAAASGRFFVSFINPSGHTVIARFLRSPANALTVDVATRFDLRWPDGQAFITQPFSNHNGGHLAFGPDGYLYVGLGDGGSGNDPGNRSQSPTTLLGKMLRLDVNVPSSHPNGYTVPPDNPFLDGQPIAAMGEIWAFGLRNPWRYSFDDFGPGATGALIIGDVGQGAREEVNYEPAGAGGRNYGWRMREGLIATPGIGATTPAYLPLTDPIFDYPRTIGRAITGGYLYRGTALPAAYRGRYFVADYVDGKVGSVGLAVDAATREARVTDVAEHTMELGGSSTLGNVASFGRDLSGELYLLSFGGRVVKIVSPAAPGAPVNLGATVSSRTVTLTWQAPSSGPPPTAYVLEVGSRAGASDIMVAAVGTQTTLTTTNVPPGVYFVRIRAQSSGLLGPASNEIAVTVTGSCPLPAMVGPVSRSGSGSQVVLSWPAASDAASYLVEAGSGTGLSNLAQVVTSSASLTATAPPGTYFVRVRARNACGTGPASAEILVTVGG
jgi:glucose/arabinose dehydrogenase